MKKTTLAGAQLERSRFGDDWDAQRARAVGRREAQPALGDDPAVLAARDQHDVIPSLEQAGTDGTTDGAGPIHHIPHAVFFARDRRGLAR